MALWTESMELPAVTKPGILSRWRSAVDDKTAKPRLDLGLALGSGDVILALPGQALRQPARVAVDGKDRIVALGQQAFEMEGREPEGVRVVSPDTAAQLRLMMGQTRCRNRVMLRGSLSTLMWSTYISPSLFLMIQRSLSSLSARWKRFQSRSLIDPSLVAWATNS